MTDEAWTHLLQLTSTSDPLVRAPALLRLSRLHAPDDRENARQIFLSAVDEIRQLAGRQRDFFLEEAQRIAAAIAPDLIDSLVPSHFMRHRFQHETLGQIMLEHGNHDAAFDLVMKLDDNQTFPFNLASMLMPRTAAPARQRALLHHIIEVGKRAPEMRFLLVLSANYSKLQPDEALKVVREVVRTLNEQEDRQTSARFGPDVEFEFTSSRQHKFFQLLHVLRKVDNDTAESLIASNDQLAAAARRYPNGLDSMMEEFESKRKQTPDGATCGGVGGFVFAGDPKDFPRMKAEFESEQRGEFDASLAHALEDYAKDTDPDDPNQAPKYFWRSAGSLRRILYSAAEKSGEKARALLERIPDADLRLFAEIEFEAALRKLPRFQDVYREFRPSRLKRVNFDRGNAIEGIRCPKCKWVPHENDRWTCKCGNVWNTFRTPAKCPKCDYQWQDTACFGCGESSKHSDWYHETENN